MAEAGDRWGRRLETPTVDIDGQLLGAPAAIVAIVAAGVEEAMVEER